jgi:hypothetical protein
MIGCFSEIFAADFSVPGKFADTDFGFAVNGNPQ